MHNVSAAQGTGATPTLVQDRAPGVAQGGVVLSKDGTRIALTRQGIGPPLILIDGAITYRTFSPLDALAKRLASQFTVFTYDRRGRGESADVKPYAVEREMEDLEAILNEAGGSAFVWGHSSGAVLALDAAGRLPGIKKVSVYEAPLNLKARGPEMQAGWIRIRRAVAEDRSGDAVKEFLRLVGMPKLFISLMQWLPMWPKLKAVAPTLPHDGDLVQALQQRRPLPPGQWTGVKVPALVMAGAKSPTWMQHGNEAIALAVSHATFRLLPGQRHTPNAKVHAPILSEFFKA
jgi:pimeloyl-ACP methyl ester carboxylesterase